MEEELSFLYRLSQPEEARNSVYDQWRAVFDKTNGLNKSFNNPETDGHDRESEFGRTDPSFQGNNLDQITSHYVISALRLSIDCPFTDIRQKAADALVYLKTKGLAIPTPTCSGPTDFIQPLECPSIDVGPFQSMSSYTDSFTTTPWTQDAEDDSSTNGNSSEGAETKNQQKKVVQGD